MPMTASMKGDSWFCASADETHIAVQTSCMYAGKMTRIVFESVVLTRQAMVVGKRGNRS